MGRSRYRRLGGCVAALLLVATGVPSAAHADGDTDGVKVGNGRLHPSLGAEARYDTLVLTDPSGAGVGDLILHLKPGLTYGLQSSAVTIDLAALGDYSLYTGIENSGTTNLSYFGGDASLNVDINPKGQVGFDLGDDFAYTDRVTAVELGAGVRSLSNDASAAIPIRPGGGALEIKPGYTFTFERFIQFLIPPTGVTNPDQLDYLSHRPSLTAKWKFLPKTAVVLDVRADLRQYVVPSVNPGTDAFYAQAGLSGLITPKIAAVLTAGYGNSFLAAGATGLTNFSSVIGQAEVSYIPSQTSHFKLGFARTFQPVPQLAWYGDNRVYLGGSFLLGGRVLLDLTAAGDFVNYANGTRNDIVITTKEDLQFKVTRWFDITVGHALTYRSSDATATGGGSLDYNRNEMYARFTLKY